MVRQEQHELTTLTLIDMVLTVPTGRTPHELVEVAPTHCPNGHPLGPRQVIASWSPTRGMSGWLCLKCGAKIWQDGSVAQEAVPRTE